MHNTTLIHLMILGMADDNTNKLEIHLFKILLLHTFVRINTHPPHNFVLSSWSSSRYCLYSLKFFALVALRVTQRSFCIVRYINYDLATISPHFFHDYRNIFQKWNICRDINVAK